MTDKICPAWNMSTGAVSRSAVTDSPRMSVGPVTLTTHPAPRIRFIKNIRNFRPFLVFSCRRMWIIVSGLNRENYSTFWREQTWGEKWIWFIFNFKSYSESRRRGSWWSPDPPKVLGLWSVFDMFFWQSNGCGGYFEQFWTKSGAVFLLFLCSQFMGKDFKRLCIFGGNIDRGVIPPRQFLPNISLSIERSFIILLPPCLSRQDASK